MFLAGRTQIGVQQRQPQRRVGPVGADAAEARAAAAEEPRGGARVPPQEEGVHQVSGEPRRRPGEPKQGAHRGAQVAQRTLLQSENRMSVREPCCPFSIAL